ncbi:EAL domain-containing protein [Paraurantiacibacter namhicola]|uniref:Phytochrome-like protein cph2 n=1 Tax=Paraurantiacibacter namhicola TaxID=645517 RepID=A0A1C7D915_9SPHN|nr:EAL domain-containing protein [Paraurantiacibacter namhicola]ANU07793.1 Phytochrome-like protein cph2 [Paraurantiacibacter namhicola]
MRRIIRNLTGKTAPEEGDFRADGSQRGQAYQHASDYRLSLMEQFEATGISWFWASNAEHELEYLSPGASDGQSWSMDEVLGQTLGDLFEMDSDQSGEAAQRPLGFQLSARTRFNNLVVKLRFHKRETYWSLTGQAVYDEEGEFLGYRGSAKDISADYEQQRDTSRAAQFDALTGLANRSRMTKRLDAVLTASKVAKRSCALLMLDLDRFKQVNDTLGHPAGDDLLKQVARRIEKIVDGKGEIGRLGGDEFQIILPDIDDRGDLGHLCNRLIQMISQPYSLDGSRATIGTSVGVAIAPYDGLESDDLVKAADLALYAAKGGGRGQFRFYSNDLKDKAQQRREIEEELRDALVRGELEMHYQPTVCPKSHKVKGFEALMRWNHPERGYISPGEFIPIAEETNLIIQLGEWALRQACADAAKWPSDLRVAVNVSAHQFAQDSLPTTVTNALASAELSPKRLELEITETVFMGDTGETDAMFRKLKGLGVRLALDDFGTGYSSLGYLRNAPFDKIKIDQSFVRGCTEKGNSNAAIISAIVNLASALGMDTTAEGVETMDELKAISAQGTSLIQGFIFSRAIPHAEVLEKLESGNLKYEPVGPSKHRAQRKTVYRRVGVIHGDCRYEAVMRDLSKSGARIEGLLDVPVGTEFILDLGEGQLVLGTVRRSQDATQGVQFETALVSDGADGLCTRHRVSPYALAAAGMPLSALPSGNYPLVQNAQAEGAKPRFMQVDVSSASSRAA